MKFINKLFIALAASLSLTACVDKDPDFQVFEDDDVDFTYNVDGDEYALDYYVVTPVQFNNKSTKSGKISWDFGDGTTSTEENPVHKYETAGVYRVTLNIEGVGSRTYPIMIFDIVPVLTVDKQSTEIIERAKTELTFNLELPNPENLRVRYDWKFPEGTVDLNGNPVTTFTGYADANGNIEYPEPVKFNNIGSQRIEISTTFDLDGANRPLEDTYLNVQVGVSDPAPTIYYAERGGNIKAMKLVDPASLPAGTKILPYDMGVSSGNTIFNLVYADVDDTDEEGNPVKNGYVYILDAGKQYYYINDESGVLGDGLIKVMRTDGTGVNTVVTNVGGPAFNDPYLGFASNGYLYYSDRNTGVSRIGLSARSVVMGKNEDKNRDDYVWQNNLIPYYNRGIGYGAIHTAFEKDSKGIWWWAKNYSGTGIYRFKDSDIYSNAVDAGKAKMPYPIVLPGIKPRAMAIDEARKALYIYRVGTPEGFYVYNLPGDNEAGEKDKFLTGITLSCKAENTVSEEGIFVCQFALDKATGRVYFCYRPVATDTSKIPAGVVYYDPDTQKIVHYGDAFDQATGICINPNLTKLF